MLLGVRASVGVTVIGVVPCLGALFESPWYDASIVSLPAALPVTMMLQVPPESVHVAGDGMMTLPVPDCEKMTVPLGDRPVTVAVQEVVAPTLKEEGEQPTEVEEESLSDITQTLPLLP